MRVLCEPEHPPGGGGEGGGQMASPAPKEKRNELDRPSIDPLLRLDGGNPSGPGYTSRILARGHERWNI